MKKRSTLKWMGLALAGLGAAASSSAMAHVHVESKGGLKIYDPSCCDYWFAIAGRLNFDETIFEGGWNDKRTDFPSSANIRRAYLKFWGGVGQDLAYNLTVNFNGSLVRFEDAWLQWTGLWEDTFVRVGQFTPLTTIDGWGNWGTVNDTVFLESALATNAFQVPQKALGLWVNACLADMFTFGLTGYQPQENPTSTATNVPSPNNYQNPAHSDRWGGATRLTFSPVHCEDNAYHLGVLGRYQSMNRSYAGQPAFQTTLFNTFPEAVARNASGFIGSGFNPTSVINTGNIRATSYNVVSADALGLWGPFFIEGEYHRADVQRIPVITTSQRGNLRFDGWHVQAGYMLTGESRRYDFKNGTLLNPCVCSPCGAWELAARYSYVDMVDKDVYGGTEHNVTVGLNWFVNDNVKIAANYIFADIRSTNMANPTTTTGSSLGTSPTPVFGAKRQLNIFGLRFQVVF